MKSSSDGVVNDEHAPRRPATFELSGCIELLFTDDAPNSPDERVRRAADAGLCSVEIWFWRDKDLPRLKRALVESNVDLYAMISEPMGQLVDRRTHEAFLRGVDESSKVAADLGCPFLMVFGGNALPGVSRAAQHGAVVDALKRAAPVAEAHDVVLALECLNSRIDHVGSYLDRTSEGLAIVAEVGSPNVTLLYDLYHSVVMGESPDRVLAGRLERVSHVQVADVPGRHEPGTGTINWTRFMDWLSKSGYQGRIGLEYVPAQSTLASLAQARSILATGVGATKRPSRPPTA